MTNRDTTIATFRSQLDALLKEVEECRREDAERIGVLESDVADLTDQLESARAELETVRALRDANRADADDTAALKESMREKDQVIAKLEECVNRYTATIVDLKHKADDWKEQYEALKAANIDPDATSTELHPLEDDAEPGEWVEELFRGTR